MNGWPNYQTAAAAEWAYNFLTDEIFIEVTKGAADRSHMVRLVADALLAGFNEELDHMSGYCMSRYNSIFSDLLNYAAIDVDWYRIADALVN